MTISKIKNVIITYRPICVKYVYLSDACIWNCAYNTNNSIKLYFRVQDNEKNILKC